MPPLSASQRGSSREASFRPRLQPFVSAASPHASSVMRMSRKLSALTLSRQPGRGRLHGVLTVGSAVTRKLLPVLLGLLVLAEPAQARQSTEFAHLVARLSEPGGYFDSDNLVSNETSYLHVLPALRTLDLHGGAYVGVGPEQNFSYIAELKPAIAILIDIRRDNMLLHLLFKA